MSDTNIVIHYAEVVQPAPVV